ncbi:MAG: lipopolysaccharide transport periplasmic protein LptA [Limnohabitans sp.]|jgi:lipopolysaccharide export system protein LptA|uniref:lipopolysaccharide transport periplasmic protein LptA n=1 Tax=Limnohabitans sp. TaxID=1907725 RepID=UPI0025E4BDD8|nr:lipopolysaccharide transport periplasmic protein LptA [Limnohabitans sp.]MCO4089619.1 lipopolysaccharide transport periplasmic protein LptA [Limnohabitans sp.]
MPHIKLSHQPRPARAILALCISLVVWPCLAEKADRDKPMQIEADSMRHDEAKLLTQFTGKVLATKGTLIMRGARMQVQQDAQGRQVATLWAAPAERVFFRQKREGLNEYTEGEAEEVTYDNQTDIVTLMRRAEVRILRGTEVANQLHGHSIVFNNSTEVVTVDGQTAQAAEQRTRATLVPRVKSSAAEATVTGPTLRSSPSTVPAQKP